MRATTNPGRTIRALATRSCAFTVALVVAVSLSAGGATAQTGPQIEPDPTRAIPPAGPGVVGDAVNELREDARAVLSGDETDQRTLVQRASGTARACRDALRTGLHREHPERFQHDVRRECIQRPEQEGRAVVYEITVHLKDCWSALRDSWYEVARNAPEECVHAPTATVEGWIGLDRPHSSRRRGVLP